MNRISRRQLIVNADDFGFSSGVNRGIIRCHESGIVTSASLMVRCPGAVEAAAYARSRQQLSVGLHVDLGEWRCSNDEWRAAYEVVPISDAAAVIDEFDRQLTRFRELLGRDPTHLDSHQHVHGDEPVRSVLHREAGRLGIVLRGVDASVAYCGAFYGQSAKGASCPSAISVDALLGLFRQLPGGTTELGCHPGADPAIDSVYRDERSLECEALCDARVRAALDTEEIRLCSFLNMNGGSQ